MGGQGSPEKLLSSPSTGGSANDLCSDHQEGPNILFDSEAGRSEDKSSPPSLSQWIHCPETSPSYVEFLMKNLEMVPPPEMLEMIGSPASSAHGYGAVYGTSSPETPHGYVEFLTENLEKISHTETVEMIGSPAGSAHAYDAVAETWRELGHNDAPKSYSSGDGKGYFDKKSGKLIASAYTVSSTSHEASARVRNQKPYYGGESMNRSTSSEAKIERHPQQKYHLWTSEPNRNDCKVFQHHPQETSAAPNLLSGPQSTILRRRAVETDRLRKLRVSERLKALQELLPNPSSVEGDILDDVTDYVKFLQFQVKELSRSRLASEPTFCPFLYQEGYGHYVFHEQKMNGPLEETMGKLLETNPSAATRLLATKGLYLMPMSLVGGSPKVA